MTTPDINERAFALHMQAMAWKNHAWDAHNDRAVGVTCAAWLTGSPEPLDLGVQQVIEGHLDDGTEVPPYGEIVNERLDVLLGTAVSKVEQLAINIDCYDTPEGADMSHDEAEDDFRYNPDTKVKESLRTYVWVRDVEMGLCSFICTYNHYSVGEGGNMVFCKGHTVGPVVAWPDDTPDPEKLGQITTKLEGSLS
jgi:hypothetical protein